jgi:hypothetical protein
MTIITPHVPPDRLHAACSAMRERAHDRGQTVGFCVYSPSMRAHALVVLLVGCGNVTAAPDAPIADMPNDGPFLGAHRHYVVDHQVVPTSSAEAQANGLDVDGDGDVDNQLGNTLGALSAQGFDVKGATNFAIDHGTILMLLDVQAPDLVTAAAAAVAMYQGANPNPPACDANGVCRGHLAGTATFAIAAASPNDPPLAASITGGTLLAGPGLLPIQVAVFDANPVTLELHAARAKLGDLTDTTIGSGIIAGAVTQGDIDTKFIPQAQQSITAIVQRDCPSAGTPPACGCASGSEGGTLISLFDTSPNDCQISVDEIRNNSIIQSLLAPDVTIEGQQMLSFGFGITAVRGEFTPP